jgi:hypothetical protein
LSLATAPFEAVKYLLLVRMGPYVEEWQLFGMLAMIFRKGLREPKSVTSRFIGLKAGVVPIGLYGTPTLIDDVRNLAACDFNPDYAIEISPDPLQAFPT